MKFSKPLIPIIICTIVAEFILLYNETQKENVNIASIIIIATTIVILIIYFTWIFIIKKENEQ